MDLISHGLMGTMMAGFGLKKKFGSVSLVAMAIASVAPDFDVITCIKGPKAFYKYHRELTHSLVGAAILWTLISIGIYFFIPLHNLLAVVSMAGVGLAGHLLLDSLTPWGLPLFYPFKRKKYGFDLIWFFDPVLFICMIGGAYGAYFLADFEREIYSLTLSAIAIYLLLRAFYKKKALKIASCEVPPRYKEAEVYVLPSAVSPFLWDVIMKSRSRYLYISVDARKKKVLNSREFSSSAFNRYVKCSCVSETVRVFLKRARFPFYTVYKEDNCYKVEWSDVQLRNLGGVHGITVTVDENGFITDEKLMVKKPVRRKKKFKAIEEAV